MLEAVLLEESAGEPTDQEIMLYAESIGIDVEKERDLLYIAEEGVSANLPKGWQVLKDENNQIFYYDSKSGISMWEHPLDEYFRNCVIKARQKIQRRANTVKNSKHDESSESCMSPISNVLPHSKQDMANKQTPKGSTTNKDPNKDSRSHSRGDCKQSETNNDINQEDKNKLSMINTPGRQDPVTRRKDEVLSADDPTEYRDFKLPGSKRRDKSLTLSTPNNNNNNNKPQFYSPANRRSSNKSFKIWSDLYAENLRKADNNLTALQDKVRKSLLTDDKPITSEVINDSAPTKCNCNSRQLQDSPVKIGKSFSSLDLLNTDKKGDRTFYEKRYGVLSSDSKKIKDYCDDDDEDILCPEVGLSPTEIKGHSTSGGQTNVESPVVNCKTNSSIPNASNVMPHTEVNVKDATKSNLERQSPNQNISKANNNINNDKGFVNLSECISHLIEERSRIQGKLFRLKLLYKTYKRRLDNLNASLLALQKQTSLDPSDGLSPSKTSKPYPNSNDCAEEANTSISHHQSPTIGKQLSPTPQLPMTKVGTKSGTNSTNQKREDKSTQSPALSSSLSPASLPQCHHQLHHHSNICRTTRRSMSVPRSPLPLNHYRNSTTTTNTAAANRFLHDNISRTSQDLAVSLASIDLQLHHVLNHLDSSSITTTNHQLPVNNNNNNNYSCSECQCCCVSARNDTIEQSPCLHEHQHEEENIQHIEERLENIDLNDTPLLGGSGGCTSSNLSGLPSCSCWKSQYKSQSSNRTMELFSSPTNRLLNSYSVGVDYSELESIRASLGSLLKSARKPNNTSHTQTPCRSNKNNDRNDHNSNSPYKYK